MAIPKNFRKNLNIEPQPFGVEQRQKLFDDVSNNQGYLPRGITYEDMDSSFIDFVKTKLEVVAEGKKVPVYIVSIQRWYEFYTSWENTDEFGNITLPFIVITRKIDIQKGTTHANNYNIPGFLTWAYLKVPSSNGARDGYDIYKIPQPVAVDIQYEVRFFTTSIRQLNILNAKVQTAFSARQSYITVNGNPMPLILESIGDESQVDNMEQRRYYVQPYTLKLMGYLLNEDDFEVVPSINKTVVVAEIQEGKGKKPVKVFEGKINEKDDINIAFNFNGSVLNYTATIINPAKYTEIDNFNVAFYEYFLNDSLVSLPFTVNSGDKLKVNVISKTNNTLPCSVIFIGTTT